MNPMTDSDYSENTLVEQTAIALFHELGWEYANCFYEFKQPGGSPLGRQAKSDVILESHLRPVLQKLNPRLPREAFSQAIDEIGRDRSLMSSAQANREVYKILKDGVKVKVPDDKGNETTKIVRVIDWENPKNNDFFLASQFWITGEIYTRRPDLVGFINGLPLVFIELKAIHQNLETAFNNNITDYKDTIPQIFPYNALILLSNGTDSRIGTLTADWENFVDWKKINSEGEEGIVSLETMIRGICQPEHLLDIIENFTVFQEVRGGLIKLVAKNHQYLGVNNAIQALKEIRVREGKLGVFWHTQGSGKSVSMIFFAQKVLRKIPGNWTFVVVTDRTELDDQIYKNFASAGVVTENKAQAESGEHLRQLLREDHRYVFTLIHKFRTSEMLSNRSDIIVITDEAHRSQYDTLAMNMRQALPNASFMAFTGTPLIVTEEKTREVFGDYISIYNFKQSVDDNATVPLYYENRIPELQLTNKDLNEDIYRIIEESELDENQEMKLEREFVHQYHLITRDERLETVAQDIVKHFTGRGFQGKAMVVCIDKATAVRMYDKVQKYWKKNIEQLSQWIAPDAPTEEVEDRIAWLKYLKETDMAVVVSQSQNEIRDMKKKGLDIEPHRLRMNKEDLDTKFKDPHDPFRIVFVCAMWMTGFDVPCCSTIYLDKPMRNHTLMQTIARANRVFKDKVNGLIVDYIGVFRNLQKALAIYGTGSGGGISEGDTPVKDKQVLVGMLKSAIAELTAFCIDAGFTPQAIITADALLRVKLFGNAVDILVAKEESKKQYLSLAYNIGRLYKAILPDPLAAQVKPECVLFEMIARTINSKIIPADISEVMGKVEDLLDRSVAAEAYVIRPSKTKDETLIDLSQLDIEKLKAQFEKNRKHITAENLKTAIESKLQNMVQLNKTRMDFYQQFQQMIEEYNAGSLNIDEFFKRLVDFAQGLKLEDKRSIAENLTEEELAIFDLLTKPEMKLSNKETQDVKRVARELLTTLKQEKLSLDWRKKQQARAAVQVAIRDIMEGLPACYTKEIFERKRAVVYEHVYESYYGPGQSIYARVR
jgi:type I restriction enzyme R subunit